MKGNNISMLTIKCAVNGRGIDEVKICNLGKLNKDGEYKYQVVTKHYDFIIWHDRKKSWYWLMEKVIEKLKVMGG